MINPRTRKKAEPLIYYLYFYFIDSTRIVRSIVRLKISAYEKLSTIKFFAGEGPTPNDDIQPASSPVC